MGSERALLLALFGALGCSSPQAPAAPTQPGDAPRFDGRAVHPAPHDALRGSYYEAALRQRRDLAPPLPPDAGVDTIREGFAPWLRRRAEGLRELAGQIAVLDARSPDDAVFAAVIYATVADELRDAIRALPAPPGLDADAATLWTETRNAQVRPLARHARDAWTRCVTMLPSASPALRPWMERCVSRVEALVAQLAAEPRRARPRPQRVTLPAGCEGPELSDTPRDPEAPPPEEHAPRETAVVYGGARFQGAELSRLLAPVRAWVARSPGARLVPQSEVDAARFLRTQRRWRVGGPVCGQPPPLAALLSARHPNLVLATVSTTCARAVEAEPEPPGDAGVTADAGGDAGSGEVCTLSVDFRRAGSDDREGLPPHRAVGVAGAADDVEAWARAAASLPNADARSAFGGILGALGGGEGPVLRVLGYADVDPWLRVGPTLSWSGPGNLREQLSACATRHGGVGVYALRWTVSPEGMAREVSVSATTEPRDDSGAHVSECVRGVLSRAGFPCPRGGAPAAAHARLCLGWM